jgi:hypothetical protein
VLPKQFLSVGATDISIPPWLIAPAQQVIQPPYSPQPPSATTRTSRCGKNYCPNFIWQRLVVSRRRPAVTVVRRGKCKIRFKKSLLYPADLPDRALPRDCLINISVTTSRYITKAGARPAFRARRRNFSKAGSPGAVAGSNRSAASARW